jgi:hypothetical protein
VGYKFKKDDDFSLAFSSFHIFCWPFLLFQLSDHTFLSPAGQKECSNCFGLDLKNMGLSILVGKEIIGELLLSRWVLESRRNFILDRNIHITKSFQCYED